VYSTCLFCNRSLGANEAIEHFPVGRRLAFDVAKGRLWAVCARCGRWNLTPIDERWEAIEECERLFALANVEASTEHVGLARTRGGTVLVRVGAPTRQEFAAWRYGELFVRRRRAADMFALGTGAVAVTVIMLPAAGLALGLVGGVAVIASAAAAVGAVPHRERVVRIATDGGESIVRGGHAKRAALLRRDSGWALRVSHERGRVDLDGPDAVRVLASLLAAMNRAGGATSQVKSAVALREEAASSDAVFRAALATQTPGNSMIRGGLSSLPQPMRLALEMATHEQLEGRALDGEMAALEAEWRHAEEIAAIADDLLVPSAVSGWIARLKG
jgi:hypothetical protein